MKSKTSTSGLNDSTMASNSLAVVSASGNRTSRMANAMRRRPRSSRYCAQPGLSSLSAPRSGPTGKNRVTSGVTLRSMCGPLA